LDKADLLPSERRTFSLKILSVSAIHRPDRHKATDECTEQAAHNCTNNADNCRDGARFAARERAPDFA
jgi:hypothetical protein